MEKTEPFLKFFVCLIGLKKYLVLYKAYIEKGNIDKLNDQLHFDYFSDGRIEIQLYYDATTDYIGSYFPKKL